MTRPEPLWFHEPAMGLAVASAATWGSPRVCISCGAAIVSESCMSTVDGWIHARCYNAERAEYLSRDPEFAGVGVDGDTHLTAIEPDDRALHAWGAGIGSRVRTGTPASDQQPAETGEATGNDEIPF